MRTSLSFFMIDRRQAVKRVPADVDIFTCLGNFPEWEEMIQISDAIVSRQNNLNPKIKYIIQCTNGILQFSPEHPC
jgi:hypothetical protein